MKKLNASQLVILCLVGVLIFQQLFMRNSYKKEYERMLKEKEESYKLEIDRLNQVNDSIFSLNKKLIEDIGTTDAQISEKNTQLSNLRRKYAEQVNKFDDLSDDELATTFSNTFK